MSFVEKNLSANEYIISKGTIHWFVYFKNVFLIILAVVGFVFSHVLGIILLAAGAISFLMTIIRINSIEVAVTNKRVILKTGVASRRVVELQLNRSEGLQVSESVMGRIFGYGYLRVSSGGVSESVDFLSKPFEFKKQVNNAIEQSFSVNQNPATY